MHGRIYQMERAKIMGDLGNLIRMDMQSCADAARKDEREKIYNLLKSETMYIGKSPIVFWSKIDRIFEELKSAENQKGVNHEYQ